MIKYHNVAQDLSGDALAGATAQVQNHITGVNAPLYADDGVTPISNPLTADSSGRFSFKSPAGLFDIVVSKGGYTATLSEITLIDDPSILYMLNDEGSSLSFGDLVYVSGDGQVKKGQSDGTLAQASIVGVCVETLLTNGSTGRFRTLGLIDHDGTPGEVGFLSDDGEITDTAPATGFVVVMGRQVSDTSFEVAIALPIEQFA